jgi:TM2 domain-containing membrane protein YozV
MDEIDVSPEKKLTIILLCHFLGWFGVHRFYPGRNLSGAQCCLLGGMGIWVLLDMGLIIAGRFTDRDGRPIVN